MQKIIGEIQKTSNIKTLIRLTEFKGRQLVDIRDFFKAQSATDYGPTKKGITIDPNKIGELCTMLEITEHELQKKA